MRRFVSDFLLPLVRGGAARVGRPLGGAALARMQRELADADREAIALLADSRRALAAKLMPIAAAPPLDEATLRLGAALHNLLALGHPGLLGPGAAQRHARVADSAFALASLGPPPSAREALYRHSLLARLPEIVRVDRTVHFWLGQQAFVGRTPPRRVTALPALRRVRIEQQSRSWLREIGIPTVGRKAFLALNVASPLGEALDPLRLDPPFSWGRVLPVLRFAPLARAVAGRAVELGLHRAGDALVEALYRFAGFHDPPLGVRPSAEAVGFAVRFVAHLVWLDVLFGGDAGGDAEAAAPARAEAGVELAVLITAAARTQLALVWPADVPRTGDVADAFRRRLAALEARAQRHGLPRMASALAIAELALIKQTAAGP